MGKLQDCAEFHKDSAWMVTSCNFWLI